MVRGTRRSLDCCSRLESEAGTHWWDIRLGSEVYHEGTSSVLLLCFLCASTGECPLSPLGPSSYVAIPLAPFLTCFLIPRQISVLFYQCVQMERVPLLTC